MPECLAVPVGPECNGPAYSERNPNYLHERSLSPHSRRSDDRQIDRRGRAAAAFQMIRRGEGLQHACRAPYVCRGGATCLWADESQPKMSRCTGAVCGKRLRRVHVLSQIGL